MPKDTMTATEVEARWRALGKPPMRDLETRYANVYRDHKGGQFVGAFFYDREYTAMSAAFNKLNGGCQRIAHLVIHPKPEAVR